MHTAITCADFDNSEIDCFSSKVIPEGGFVDDEFPDAAAIGRIGDHHPKRKYLEAAVWRWGFELMPGATRKF